MSLTGSGPVTQDTPAASLWTVYIVRCADNSLYTGVAKSLHARIEKHNAGTGAKYTRSRRPVVLVYTEPVTDRSVALRREREIKRMPVALKRDLIRAAGGGA